MCEVSDVLYVLCDLGELWGCGLGLRFSSVLHNLVSGGKTH